MSKSTILISGGGLAGPVAAFWLNRAGFQTTIVERASSLRTGGQQLDIRGTAWSIIQQMGLEEAIRARLTKETGLAFVNSDGKRIAEFPVRKQSGIIAEIEIMRGALCEILYDATKDNTEYIFGDHITGIEQKDGKVRVKLASGEERVVDVLIGADGLGSVTRRLVFPPGDSLQHFNQWVAFFKIPYRKTEGNFGEWYSAAGGRCILLRPDNLGSTRVYLAVMNSAAAGYDTLNISGQKKLIRGLFEDAGWIATEVLDEMDKADDFYMTEIAQVKLDSWHQGQVALLGDAGYCPSPISGQGTSASVMGAYVLAGELSRCGGDWKSGLEMYEKTLKPWITKAQTLPYGAPWIINPQSEWGVAALRSVIGLASWIGLASVLDQAWIARRKDEGFPVYGI